MSRRATDLTLADAPLIDFLPPQVHTTAAAANDRPIRRLAAVAGLALFALGFYAHRQTTAALQQRGGELRAQQASTLDPQFTIDLRTRRDELTDRANLLATFLPRASASRLIAIVSDAVPEGSHLTVLRLDRDAAPTPTTPPKRKPAKPDAADDWTADLTERLAAQQSERTTLQLEGLVRDDRELGRFVSRLDASGAFGRIDIALSEPAELRGLPRRRFRMSVVAR